MHATQLVHISQCVAFIEIESFQYLHKKYYAIAMKSRDSFFLWILCCVVFIGRK